MLPLTMIGDYRLGRLLGRGTQGEVYAASVEEAGPSVAIKVLYGGRASDTELRTCARLQHPHIVPILQIGEHYGQPYIVMRLMTMSLADDLRRLCVADPDDVVWLMVKVAEAVHACHQAGVLHRDLKPANILMDEAGEPYVADFGVAKLLEESEHGTITGTRPYMAPEQLDGRHTVRSDVYSLGVIFYELLTCLRPFRADSEGDLNREIKEKPPANPRLVRPSISPSLARICLRCLAKAPEDRFESADALRRALQRYLNGELPEDAPWYQRAWRWCLRHALVAGACAALLMFGLITIPGVVSIVQQHEQVKLAQLTQANTTHAAMVAGAVLSHLRDLGQKLGSAARDPGLVAALEAGDSERLQSHLAGFYVRHNDPTQDEGSPFNTWFVLDREGRLTAQAGTASPRRILGLNYAWRDYSRAWALGDRCRSDVPGCVYVSRVFKSELDGYYKFALSTPIYDHRGEPVALLVAAVATSTKLGSLGFDDPDNVRALIGVRDDERDRRADSSYMILLHPGHKYGEAEPLESGPVRTLEEATRGTPRIEDALGLPPPALTASSDDYSDPVGERNSRYAGRWIAGFAPVGNTGLIVVVQTSAEVIHAEARFSRTLVAWIGLSVLPGVFFVIVGVWHKRRRRQSSA